MMPSSTAMLVMFSFCLRIDSATSGRGDDASITRNARQVPLEPPDDFRAQRGRRVPPVEKPLHGNPLDATTHAQLDAGGEVRINGMHPSRTEEPHEVQGAAGAPE